MTVPPSEDRSVLSAWLDDELSAAERGVVDARLASSQAWRDELAEVEAARAALRAAAVRDAPPDRWDELLGAVQALGGDLPLDEPVVPIGRARPRSRYPLRWAAAVAAAAVALVVIVMPQRHGVRPNVAVVATQRGAQLSGTADPVSVLAPVSVAGGR
jgi:anti-sigma factor RsiW